MTIRNRLPALLTAAILACAHVATGAQTLAQLRQADDLAAAASEARASGVPILLAFTESGCRYCVRARDEYLRPLQASATYGAKVLMREVEIRNAPVLRGFSGHPVTPAAFARGYRVSRVPTVIVVGYDGKPLADPVIGLLGEDFYQFALERAIDAGLATLRRPAF